MDITQDNAADQADSLLLQLAAVSITPAQRHGSAVKLIRCASLLATVEPYEAKAQVTATIAMAHLALAQIDLSLNVDDLPSTPAAAEPVAAERVSRVRINTGDRPA